MTEQVVTIPPGLLQWLINYRDTHPIAPGLPPQWAPAYDRIMQELGSQLDTPRHTWIDQARGINGKR